MWIPISALKGLTCSNCDNLLSIFPVYSNEADQSFTCGRCIGKVDGTQLRQSAYEALAQHVRFPCRYEKYGCSKFLTPEIMALHESSCTHTSIHCPYMPENTCLWQGKPSDLYEHYKKVHTHRVLKFKGVQKADFKNSHVENFVFQWHSETFIVRFEYHPDKKSKYTCHINYCGVTPDVERHIYAFITFSNHAGESYKFSRLPVTASTKYNPENTTAVDVSKTKPVVTLCEIIIIRWRAKVIKNLRKVDAPLLSIIECPVCLTYMLPPIKQCPIGHSICGECILQVTKCPICRQPMGDTRNFLAESVAQFITYPCKHRNNNCRFQATWTDIRQHELECEFAPISCPIGACNWNDKLSLMKNHVREAHDTLFLDVDTIVHKCMPPEDETYLAVFNDQFFRLEVQYDDGFYWFLQLIGPAKDHRRYMLELDILNGRNERILARKACGVYGDVKMDKEQPHIELCRDMLIGFIEDDYLIYNFRIVFYADVELDKN